jgi:hypothetical protein
MTTGPLQFRITHLLAATAVAALISTCFYYRDTQLVVGVILSCVVFAPWLLIPLAIVREMATRENREFTKRDRMVSIGLFLFMIAMIPTAVIILSLLDFPR